MSSVTQRIKEVKQPRGGYLKPSALCVRQMDDGNGECRYCSKSVSKRNHWIR